MIPKSILLKIKPVVLVVNGVEVKTTIVDNPGVVSKYLEEFKYLIRRYNVVGFDVKRVEHRGGSKRIWGVVCAETRCLVFLCNDTILEAGIGEFFNNQDVSFIGTEVSKKVQLVKDFYERERKYVTMVEIGYFVARVLMRAELETLELRDLASVVFGIKRELPTGDPKGKAVVGVGDPILNGAEVLSLENLVSVVEEAYTCFAIANKVLTSMV